MVSIRLVQHSMEYCEQIFKLSSAPPVKEALGLPDSSVEDTKKFVNKVILEELLGQTVSRVIFDENSNLIGITTLCLLIMRRNPVISGHGLGTNTGGRGITKHLKFLFSVLRLRN
jgi:hypothetical protein